MKGFKHHRYSAITVFIIVLFIIVFTKCIYKGTNETAGIKNFTGQQFAGSSTCAGCHKNIYDSHLKTAHYRSLRIASKEYMKGSFEKGKNFYFYNSASLVAIEESNDGFYQVEYDNGNRTEAHRIDLLIGSGTRGQSHLTWVKDQLFQLPISYFTAANDWFNSPGYPSKIIFNRPVDSRCLECHSTFANTISAPGIEPEKFDRDKMIYGIDCEKCHGPAAGHVEFQTKNPTVLTAKFIINPARLSRQQNLDLCASCHGGVLQKTKPSFQFTAGDTLGHFFALDTTVPNTDKIDVHGNQFGLLRASKCFRKSEKMTCSTCHNTHENERGKTVLFSQRCMACHTTVHTASDKINSLSLPTLKDNCIDCHMPVKPSNLITGFVPVGDAPTAELVRSHHISIYPAETAKMLTFMKKKH